MIPLTITHLMALPQRKSGETMVQADCTAVEGESLVPITITTAHAETVKMMRESFDTERPMYLGLHTEHTPQRAD